MMALDREHIRRYLHDQQGLEPGDFADDTMLFSSGLIDSFSMVDLITFIEDVAGLRVHPVDVTLDNFDSINRILAFIEARRAWVEAHGWGLRLMHATLMEIARRFGTPCYVYFTRDIAARCEALRQAFTQRFRISYAVKANPNVGLLRRLRLHTDALDISSAGEMQHALRAGWSPQRLSFTGPGKRAEELTAAVTLGIAHIVVESVHEARAVSQIAGARGTH